MSARTPCRFAFRSPFSYASWQTKCEALRICTVVRSQLKTPSGFPRITGPEVRNSPILMATPVLDLISFYCVAVIFRSACLMHFDRPIRLTGHRGQWKAAKWSQCWKDSNRSSSSPNATETIPSSLTVTDFTVRISTGFPRSLTP